MHLISNLIRDIIDAKLNVLNDKLTYFATILNKNDLMIINNINDYIMILIAPEHIK